MSERATERRIWSVHALVMNIRQEIETAYGDLWVEGEISNCRPAPSGHIYFTLKDGEAQLPVVLFRRQAGLLRFRPEDGLAVLVRGRVSVYESRGQLQLIGETMEPRGAGSLQLAFEQLKARLLAEGLFDAERKRQLPSFPKCVGIVTSLSGAVIRDIVTVVRRRHARLNLLVYPAMMQGASSPESVAAGIRWFNTNSSLVDAIVIARGGGSMEDLAGFNDEALARTVAASALPVVSAIGHETDFTIADFVADLRAPTPSAAAELITAAQHRIEERVAALGARVKRAGRFHLMHARQRYTRLSAEAVLNRLRDTVSRKDQRLDELRFRLDAAAQRCLRVPAQRLNAESDRLRRQDISVRIAATNHRLQAATQRLQRTAMENVGGRRTRVERASTRLDVLSPLAVLSRGYALVYLQGGAGDGTLLRSSTDAAPGQTIRARLAQGTLEAEITQTQRDEANIMETSKS
ncbi:exodeoxyribonuclease VII large subunit [Tunturibacter empetritectus]|uniref:Exodeoxyribonuclease 7 large subunit n=1 Tax=Tunturiibacter lichenicola TaxID=2051959 RepID=A0A7W8N5E6_9BACT|nr:exodeoxyribonuclease VII large subunit [Edaphobacter lichenicola]MBB5344491.1 exodeoxyribonuclease VII large subunit [Edaphobacter lichenicola]